MDEGNSHEVDSQLSKVQTKLSTLMNQHVVKNADILSRRDTPTKATNNKERRSVSHMDMTSEAGRSGYSPKANQSETQDMDPNMAKR